VEGTHPFKEVKLNIWGPEEDTSIYYGPFKPVALGLDGNSLASDIPRLMELVPPPGVDASAFYNLVRNRRRGFSDNLLAIDQAANNTSLVFSLEWRGWKLLFPGDAEIRSWRTMDVKAALENVHFLKVSHHASFNGTPLDLLQKILPSEAEDGRARYAVASTYAGTYDGIPDPGAEQALRPLAEWHTTQEVGDGEYLDFLFFEDCSSRVEKGPMDTSIPSSEPETAPTEEIEEQSEVASEVVEILTGEPQPETAAGEAGAGAAGAAPAADAPVVEEQVTESAGNGAAPVGEAAGAEASSPLALDETDQAIDERLHILNLSKDGTFLRTGVFESNPEDVDAIFEQIAREKTSHLVLYFHGGMVSEQSGLDGARTLLPQYRIPGTLHPVFFVWETGWKETILHNLESVNVDGLFERIVPAVLKFLKDKLEKRFTPGGLGLAGEEEPLEPVQDEEAEALAETLLEDDKFRDAVNTLVEDLKFERRGGGLALDGTQVEEQERPQRTLLNPAIQEEMLDEDSRGGMGLIEVSAAAMVLIKAAVRVFKRVVKRYNERTEHGPYGTVAEEILRELYVDHLAGWLWQQIKDEARQSFEDNDGLTGKEMHGGTYFLEKLREYIEDPEHQPLKVSLVGHSAGSIYISRLVEKADKVMPPDFQFEWVIFLAPAVDFKLFRKGILDRQRRVANFRMYTMLDELEAQDVMVPVIYPQSILFFVSALLEGEQVSPVVGQHRHYLDRSPFNDETMRAVRKFMLDPNTRRVVWAVVDSGDDGFLSGARKHGGFGSEPLTVRSVLHLLKTMRV
jgi:hypothetical protein